MSDIVEAGIEKAAHQAVALEGAFFCRGHQRGPHGRGSRGATDDHPSMVGAATRSAIDIVASLGIGIDRDIWHFAEPVGEGISNAGSLLPGWHRPHLADTAAARAVVYSTVIP